MNHTLWIGSYSSSDASKHTYNPGVSKVTLDASSGKPNFAQSTLKQSSIECENPSFVAHFNNGQLGSHLMAVTEHCAPDTPGLNILNPETLQNVKHFPLTGDAPCHLEYSARHQSIAIAHYMGGNITIIDANDPNQAQVIMRTGSGPNAQRQESAHLHQVKFLVHSNHLLAVDLGCDQILQFDLIKNEEGVTKATLDQVIELPKGGGPRHVVLNDKEDQLYVLCELTESICHYRLTDEMVWEYQNEYALLDDQPTQEAAAAIRLSSDGKTLYASARAQNKIVSFTVESLGRLSPLQIIDCGGKFPRDFDLSPCGNWMVVANQHSHSLSVLKVDTSNGLLSATPHSLTLGSPVCVLF
jgi:6-phosphogluconolactonase